MFDPMHVKVKKWLENTISSSESAVDHGWTVVVDADNERKMTIDTPDMPFKLIVQVDTDLTYCAFVTAITTKGKGVDIIEPVFRGLLSQNRHMGLSKFCLLGDEDNICLRTDLYTEHMNKEEFNLALEAVILGGRWLIAELGQTEDENRIAKEMGELVAAELLKGTAKEDVVSKMRKAGYSEENATALVNKLAQDLGLESKPEPEKTKEENKEQKDNPVDKYIW